MRDAELRLRGRIGATILAICLLSLGFAPTSAEPVENTPGIARPDAPFPEGAKIYAQTCAACHETGAGRAPLRVVLGYMTPEAILSALTDGAMREQGAALSEKDRRAVAQHLSGAPLGQGPAPAPPVCSGRHARFDMTRPPRLEGAGLDPAGTRVVPRSVAGLTPAKVPELRLKWAFGFAGANRARSQPALGGGALFVGSHSGMVHALDRETGCQRWQFRADAEVRTAIVLSGWEAGDEDARPMVFFGDWQGNAYALDARTGKQVWKRQADDHPAAVITASPVLHQGTLYVPVSSLEEASAAGPGYRCCTFRGSVLALDAASGAERWRTWLVDEPRPDPEGRMFGPSGVPVWGGLAVDAERGALLAVTGDNYTRPATDLSDAILALDLETGAIRWSFQALEGDAWNVSCVTPEPDNCPEDAGPDYDFGAGPVLVRNAGGRDLVLGGQKSGIVWAVDAQDGALVWSRQVGRGGMAGGVHFGLGASAERTYVGISDMPDGVERPFPASPGLHALNTATGEPLWFAKADAALCEGRPLCLPGVSGALSATPDMVLAGSDDGFVRIHDALTGKLLWEHDTTGEIATVNGVIAHGGAISGGAAPILADGQLIVSSGYGFVSKMPGNVLLVFEAE